ncbi:unnamed protein product [Microthlaspi erraticum]|uniref:Uncharacterized protein n=1 Tax=Microthlaspi erraticum TaxID=1685480 RepID=A0A6D2JBA2_9BRAS|nr:unnamed protein product [Microthlaspi erraticum]
MLSGSGIMPKLVVPVDTQIMCDLQFPAPFHNAYTAGLSACPDSVISLRPLCIPLMLAKGSVAASEYILFSISLPGAPVYMGQTEFIWLVSGKKLESMDHPK